MILFYTGRRGKRPFDDGHHRRDAGDSGPGSGSRVGRFARLPEARTFGGEPESRRCVKHLSSTESLCLHPENAHLFTKTRLKTFVNVEVKVNGGDKRNSQKDVISLHIVTVK